MDFESADAQDDDRGGECRTEPKEKTRGDPKVEVKQGAEMMLPAIAGAQPISKGERESLVA